MLQENHPNPLLSQAENAHLAELRDSQQGQVSNLTNSHDSRRDSRESRIEWRLIYRIAIGTTAGLAAIFCTVSTLRLATLDPDHSYILMAVQDIPLVGISLALAYSAIRFSDLTVFATLATLGAVGCAAVI